MPPPLLDNVPEFFQFVDFLLFSRKGSLKYPEYYELMQRCLDQTTSEKDIFEWLSNLTIRVKRKKTLRRIKSISISQSPSIPAEFFIKRCQEMGGQYFQVSIAFIIYCVAVALGQGGIYYLYIIICHIFSKACLSLSKTFDRGRLQVR